MEIFKSMAKGIASFGSVYLTTKFPQFHCNCRRVNSHQKFRVNKKCSWQSLAQVIAKVSFELRSTLCLFPSASSLSRFQLLLTIRR